MSNVYYLENFRSKVEPPAPSSATIDRRAEQLRLLKEYREVYHAHLAARAARELRQPPAPAMIDTLLCAIPVVLYFVSYGRNAWHTTWIKKYQKNTLMSSYKESCMFIGGRMTQGTVFKMTVTPGWHLQFSAQAFLVCEINTSRPFSRLLEAAFTVPGISREKALMLLKPTSDLWEGAAPTHDSIIVQQTKRPGNEFVQWRDADDERESIDWIRAWNSDRAVDPGSPSESSLEKPYIYDPRKPWNYGRYIRDTSRETVADFFFRPCRNAGPSEFDCERFRVLAAAAQVVAAP